MFKVDLEKAEETKIKLPTFSESLKKQKSSRKTSISAVFGRNDAKAETPVLWPPHAKSWLIGKDSDAGKDWRQEEKGTTEDEMAGWHHWVNGRESEWTPGVGDGQGGPACCDSWGRKESDTTERLNWTELNCFIDYAKAFDCVDHNKLWKILKAMGIPDHLICLTKNLCAHQEATVRTGHGTTDWFQIGKRVRQSCILSPCLFNFYAEYIMRNAGLEEAQAGIKIAGRNINNLRYADDHLWQKAKKN